MSRAKKNTLLQLYTKAPNSRDYYGLTISTTHVILNIWNVSRGRYVYPKRQVAEHADFLTDVHLQNQIRGLFGAAAIEYALGVCRGDRNLQYLPTRAFLWVLRCLAANDVLRLSQTSKILFELCNTEPVWELLFKKRTKKHPTHEDSRKAGDIGWKNVLKNKICKRVKEIRKNLGGSEKKAAGKALNSHRSLSTISSAVVKPKEAQKKVGSKVSLQKVATNKEAKKSIDTKCNGDFLKNSWIEPLKNSRVDLQKGSKIDVNKSSGLRNSNVDVRKSNAQTKPRNNSTSNQIKISGLDLNRQILSRTKVDVHRKSTSATVLRGKQGGKADILKTKPDVDPQKDLQKSLMVDMNLIKNCAPSCRDELFELAVQANLRLAEEKMTLRRKET